MTNPLFCIKKPLGWKRMNTQKKIGSKNGRPFQWLCKGLVTVALSMVGLSCQLILKKKAPVPESLISHKKGVFSGPVTLYQKKKRYYLHGDIFILTKNQLRMDFSLGSGVPVFTVLLNKNQLILLSLRKKEFYKGPVSSIPFQGTLLPMEELLSFMGDLFFDRPPHGPKWVCEKDQELPTLCHNQKWRVQWQRKGKRLVSIKKADFALHFQYDSFSSEVDLAVFDMTIPKSFKPIFLLK